MTKSIHKLKVRDQIYNLSKKKKNVHSNIMSLWHYHNLMSTILFKDFISPCMTDFACEMQVFETWIWFYSIIHDTLLFW